MKLLHILAFLFLLAATSMAVTNITACDFATAANTDYQLNASLTCGATNGINVTTGANVSIDCQGFSLIGDNSSAHYGVYSTQFNTTVQNCNISNFGTGIYFLGATNGTISNVTIYTSATSNYPNSTGNGILLKSSANKNIIINTNSTTISGSGIMLFSAANNNQIINSTGTSTAGIGINIQTSSYHNQVINSTGISLGYNGISVSSSINTTVTTSTGIGAAKGISFSSASDNCTTINSNFTGDNGIDISGTSGIQIINTTAYSATSHAIYLSSASSNIILNLTRSFTTVKSAVYIDGGANNSIDCQGASLIGSNGSSTYGIYSTQFNTTVKNCNISNFSVGIYFDGADNGTINNNNVSTTRAYSFPNGQGILVYVGSNYNTISNNNATATLGYGIVIRGSSNYNLMINSTGITSSVLRAGIDIEQARYNEIINSIGYSTVASSGAGGTGIYLTDASYNNILNLTRSFTTNGSAIYIDGGANNSIDCQGASLTGSNASSTYGIYSNQLNTTIQNCLISNFTDGIRFSGASNGTILNSIASSTFTSGNGIYLTANATNNTITGTIGNAVTGHGIYADVGSSNNRFISSRGASVSGNGIKLSSINNTFISGMADMNNSPGLVSYWKLDNTSSTIAVDSRGQNNGTLINSPVWVTGQSGTALSFNGVNQSVNIPNSANLNPGTSDFTITAWVNTNNNLTRQVIIAKETDTGESSSYGIYKFEILDTGNLRAYISDGVAPTSPIARTSVGTLSSNQWYYATATYVRNGNLTIYINGVLDSVVNIAAENGDVSNTFPAYIGKRNLTATPRWFNGSIDEVMFFSRALSADEILLLYQNPTAKFRSAMSTSSHALYNLDSNNTIVANTSVTSSTGYGVYISNSSAVLITNLTANQTGSSALAGCYVKGTSSNITITNSICQSLNGQGYLAVNTNNNTATNNVITSTANIGAYLLNSSSNTFSNNILNANFSGLRLENGSATNDIRNNTFTSTSSYGVSLFNATNNYFANNTNSISNDNSSQKFYSDGTQNIASRLNLGWWPTLTADGSAATAQNNTAFFNGSAGGRSFDWTTNVLNTWWFGGNTTPVLGCFNLTVAGVSYMLANNVSINNATCVNVNVQNASLDCIGFSMVGNNATSTYGVYSNQVNSTVKNCNISNFAEGLYFASGANNGTILNVNSSITKDGEESIYIRSNNNVITNVTSSSSSSGRGITIQGTSNNTITNSNFTSGTSYGVWFYSSAINNQLINTTAYSATSHAIYIQTASNNNILNLTRGITTAKSAVYIDGGQNNSIDCQGANIIGNNGSATYGIYSTQFNTTIKNCNISNFDNGILFTGATFGTISNVNTTNTLTDSIGVSFASGANNNIITNLNATAQSRGIRLLSTSSNNVFTNVSGTAMSGVGIYSLTSSGNNTFTDSYATGINAFLFDASSNNKIINSTAYSGATHAFALQAGSNNNVLNLTQSFTTKYSAVYISGGQNNSVDCKGASLIGGNITTTYGVYSTQFNTTVQNCNISNFSTGIRFEGMTQGLIQNTNMSTTHATGTALYLLNVNNSQVINTTIKSEGGRAVYLSGSSNNNITNMAATAVSNSGIEIYNIANNNIVSGSSGTTSGNNVGIYLSSYCTGNSIISSNGTSTSGQGIRLDGSSITNNITNSIGTVTSGYGIYLAAASNNIISGSNGTATTSGFGIYIVSGANNNQIQNTIANGNTSYALRIDDSNSTIVTNLTANQTGTTAFSACSITGMSSNTTLQNSICVSTNGQGILISGANNNTILNNLFLSTASNAIYVLNSNGTLISNNTGLSNMSAFRAENCTNNVIQNNNMTSNVQGNGCYILTSHGGTRINNTCIAANYINRGLLLSGSQNNSFLNGIYYAWNNSGLELQNGSNWNTFNATNSSSNTSYGIYLLNSSSNYFINTTNDLGYNGVVQKFYSNTAQNTSSFLNMGWWPLLAADGSTAVAQVNTSWFGGVGGGRDSTGAAAPLNSYWFNNQMYYLENMTKISFVSPSTADGTVLNDSQSVKANVSITNLEGLIVSTTVYIYNSTALQTSTTVLGVNNTYLEFANLYTGDYYYNATVNDTLGRTFATSTIHVSFLDTTTPTINFVAPTDANNSIVYNRRDLPVNASAADKEQLKNITIYFYNESGLVSVTNANQTTNVSSLFANFTGLAYNRNYSFYATAFDVNNNSVSTGFYYVRLVDNIKPSPVYVPVTQGNGTTINHSYVEINVSVTDNDAVANVTTNLYNSTGSLVNTSFSATAGLFANFSLNAYGQYYFNATAYDLVDNFNSTQTYTFQFADITHPEVNFTAPTPANNTVRYRPYLEINLSAGDQGPIQSGIRDVNFTVFYPNGLPYYSNSSNTSTLYQNVSLPYSTFGNYTYIGYTRDNYNNSNNTGFRALDYRVWDTPVITIISPANNTITNGLFFNFSYNITTLTNTTVKLYRNGVLMATDHISDNQTLVHELNFTQNGTYWWYVNATLDEYTYVSAQSGNYRFVIDQVGPVVTITSPYELQQFGDNPVIVQFTAVDEFLPISNCWYKLNLGPNVPIVSCANFNITGLQTDLYTLTIFANDSLNNIGSNSVRFVVGQRQQLEITTTTSNNTAVYESVGTQFPIPYTQMHTVLGLLFILLGLFGTWYYGMQIYRE